MAAAAVTLALLGASSPNTGAAEIRLRTECRCSKVVVTLGDVAEVLSSDQQQAQALAAVELFPTPPAGSQRYVRARELQDLLLLRGVNLIEHQFSGSSQVTVVAMREAQPDAPQALPESTLQRAKRLAAQAVARHLQENVSSLEAWQADVKLSDEEARLVAAGSEISASGGREPWVGAQPFEITVKSAGQPVRFPVTAQVSLSPAVVVAARSIAAGATISAADLALDPAGTSQDGGEPFTSIEEAVGQQAARMIPAGKALDRGSVRSPVLVRRGEVVTVYSCSPGIRVKVTARARDDGSLGQIVTVENLTDRKAYFARVSGAGEVEVNAQAVQAGPAAQSSMAERGLSRHGGRFWR